ncbi:hypothetical protein OQI_29550 [Streptomyces pharetrae CZA14]|uniref:Uncharacterized protein n=1 Tax=Streptomyces pharetrae CZA14 TaxID=1144883 RepID=A0ABX3YC16_9ACTN|nr:hypothetical protein OQI_29550 [Streptomyces pharetrae CZA14]
MESSEQDTKSTSGARSTNTPNLPFFFSPYVISRSRAQPGCWPALMCVNSLMTPGRWGRSRRSAVHRGPLS